MTTPGELPAGIREIGESRFAKILVYAMWGVGKTIFTGSGGPRSLILRPPTDHTDSIISFYPSNQRPKEWIIRDWDEMDQAGEYLRLHGQEWDWVSLDSLSVWQDTGLDDIWAATIEKFPHRLAKHAGIDKGEYGRNMDRISQWVRNVVSLDTFNFMVTAFPTARLESPDGESKLMPWVQGKMMSEKVCGYMNMVGYMTKRKAASSGRVFRQIDFNETEDFYAKDQFNCWPNGRLIDPTLPKLLEAVAAAKGKPKATPAGKRRTPTAAPSGKKRRTT